MKKVALLVRTVKGYVQYLARCEDCAHRDEAKEEIKELKLPPHSPGSGKGSWRWVAAVCVLVAVAVGFNFWGKHKKEAVVIPAEPQVAVEIPVPAPAHPPPYRDPYTGMEFVLIKGGCFWMGNNFTDYDYLEENPRDYEDHDGSNEKSRNQETCVGDYYLGKYEVTQGEWSKLMKNESDFQNSPRYPVENVSWHQAQEYIGKLNKATGKQFRMPTEAEWEYAARERGKMVRFGTGKDTIGEDEANFDASERPSSWVGGYQARTMKVGSFSPNSLGLYDMSGNVSEWTCSEYGSSYNGSRETSCAADGSGATRVNRGGGGWHSTPADMRAADRGRNEPGDRFDNLGFRLALPSRPGG